MKRFKQYLIEEMSTDKVAPEATNVTPQSSVTPPAPAMFAPDSVKQLYSKTVSQQQDPNLQPGNNEEVSDEELNPPPPTYEEWYEENPMPDELDYDIDGDGKLNDEERRRYNDAIEWWNWEYEQWREDWRVWEWERDRPPEREFDWSPDSNEPYTPGHWEHEFEEWYYRRFPEERERGKPDLEEYEYWREIWEKLFRRVNNVNLSHPYWRELFDWMWRYREWQRGGEQGDPPYPPDPDFGGD